MAVFLIVFLVYFNGPSAILFFDCSTYQIQLAPPKTLVPILVSIAFAINFVDWISWVILVNKRYLGEYFTML